jgi:hypothetical protein
MRVTVGSDTYIASPVFVGADGETPADCTGSPTATVINSAGSVLAALVVDKSTSQGAGQYRGKLDHTVHTAVLDTLTVTWTGVVDGLTKVSTVDVEVDGGPYMTPTELRDVSGLDDPGKFPSGALARVVSEFTDIAEEYCGVAFVPRLASETIVQQRGNWRTVLDNPRLRTIRTLSVNDVVVDPSKVQAVQAGWIDWWKTGGFDVGFSWHSWPFTVRVTYEHGFDSPPEPILRACREYVRSTLLQSMSGLPRNIIRESTIDGTSVQYGTANRDQRRPTGFMTVDAALDLAPNYKTPAVA